MAAGLMIQLFPSMQLSDVLLKQPTPQEQSNAQNMESFPELTVVKHETKPDFLLFPFPVPGMLGAP